MVGDGDRARAVDRQTERPWLRGGRVILENLRSLAGSLVLVPLVVVLFGSHWEWKRSVVPSAVMLVDPGSDAEEGAGSREVRLHFYDDGGDPGRGIPLPTGSYLQLELPRAVESFRVTIQVDFNDVYEVQGAPDTTEFVRLWQVPRGHGGSYLTTRQSDWIDSEVPIRFLRVRALRGNSPHVVAGLRLELQPLEIAHSILIPVLWGVALLLWLIARARPGSRADRFLHHWQRSDLWVAAILIAGVVLRIPTGSLMVALAVIFLWLVLRFLSFWWSRAPASLFGVITTAALLSWFVPKVFETVIVARIAELHDLTVDHRLLPGPDVNSDRIRFREEAADLEEEDFVILFAGDSFTYGLELEYEQAYPYVLEELVTDLDCSQRVRAVNMGWTSSSPLLALRLLREIGYKYEPDLLIYNLDMTDFHDDLSYEVQLRQGGDLEIDPGEAVVLLLARNFPGAMQYLPNLQVLRNMLRGVEARPRRAVDDLVPEDRFFVTNQPLEESIGDIERGVIRNLAELNLFVTETLGGAMALVVYPRSYQYSLRESPRNWEAHLYEVLGPYVREPFNYFEKSGDRMPFAVLNLLPAFEATDEYPLFLEDDPHWNAAGARFVADAVARWAVGESLLPCRPESR